MYNDPVDMNDIWDNLRFYLREIQAMKQLLNNLSVIIHGICLKGIDKEEGLNKIRRLIEDYLEKY